MLGMGRKKVRMEGNKVTTAEAETAAADVADENLPVIYPEPLSRLIYVNVNIAMDFLSRSDKNRSLSRDRSAKLAEAFERGEHRLTGDAIVFNRYGLMTNGQHRCLAVIMATMPPDSKGLPFWVMYGAEDDEQMVQDTGRSRSFNDHLRIKQVTNANAVSGVVKLLWSVNHGIIQDLKVWHERKSPTVFQLDEFWRQNEDAVRDSIKYSDRIRHKLPMNTSVLAVAWITFSAIDKDDAEGFWDQLSLKTETSCGAIRSLISQVLAKKQDRSSRGKRESGWHRTFDSRHQLALIIKAWNSYRTGREISLLVFKSGGVNPESFPVPQ